MKCVMLMFDSLNRHMLPPYGGSVPGGSVPPVHAPNFARLAERTAVFDRSYICSMPCMPARRDLHTGRPNFLHRSWGPIEPFDDSVPDFLRQNGVYTHLSSDHYHYWEEGGANYHARYRSWEFFRGQEGDPWIGMVTPPPAGNALGQNASEDPSRVQDRVNRRFMRTTAELPQSQTVAAGIDFMRRNHDEDNWFLHMETFDPHEPFFSQREFKDRYAEHYAAYRAKNGPLFDWPSYNYVSEDAELVDHMRHEYASLVSMCDARLGDVLDTMDELSLWDDTMFIVWTDHGFLLGEHECWAKVWAPYYEEVSHTPFFVWDPRVGARAERREALVQPSIDLGPTLLSYFGFERFDDMLGCDLAPVVERDEPVRDAAMFGQHGAHVNVTDGRYVYWRGPADVDNQELYDYTLMPARMRTRFGADDLRDATLAEPFSFTKGMRTLRVPTGVRFGAERGRHADRNRSRLFDLQIDPGQTTPLEDDALEARMVEHLVRLMAEADAPPEQYRRLGLAQPA
jgi:arylsulfatase A-like enzyme